MLNISFYLIYKWKTSQYFFLYKPKYLNFFLFYFARDEVNLIKINNSIIKKMREQGNSKKYES